jgi:hypothetical protein
MSFPVQQTNHPYFMGGRKRPANKDRSASGRQSQVRTYPKAASTCDKDARTTRDEYSSDFHESGT